MMKNMDQKLNKKHLSFMVACLCSTIFFNDSPSWGMDHGRPDDLLNEQRPLRRQRLEEEYDYSLKNHATPVAILRESFKTATEEFKNSQVNPEQMSNSCNRILDDNPATGTMGEYPLPNSTKEKLQHEITELLRPQSRTIKKYEKLARDPIARFDEMTRTLSFRGKIIGTSDIDQILKNNIDKGTQPNTINISASDTFLVDEGLIYPGLMFNVETSLFSIGNNKIIDLTGLKGADGQDDNGFVASTQGEPGKKGGTFTAKASKIDDPNRFEFTIKVDGGRGGNGGNGKDGADGSNGGDGILGTPPDARYYLGEDYDMDYVKSKRTAPQRMFSKASLPFSLLPTETVFSESGKLQWYKAQKEEGTPGQDGSNASVGGIGGKAGTASLEINGTQRFHIGQEGLSGNNGIPGKGGQGGKHGRNQKGTWKAECKVSEFILTAPGGLEPSIGSIIPLSPQWADLYYDERTQPSRAADGQKGGVNEPAPLLQPQDINIPMEEDNAQQQPDLDDVVEQ